MMRRILTLLLVGSVLGLFVVSGLAQEKETETEFKYIGTGKCKFCHMSKKSGAQFKIWEESAHSKAYETLGTPEAKKVAQKMDIENPQESDKCLTCHVTGYGKDETMFEKSLSMEEGVGCESCHGPGSEYKSMKVMKQIYEGKAEGAKYGLMIPTEETCKSCHNEKSPTFKGFDFKKYWAKIAHPVPEEK